MNEQLSLREPPPVSLWHNRSFLRLWIAQVVSSAGTAITDVALPLTAVLVLSATPAQMGLLTMAGSLPNLLFGLVAGVWPAVVAKNQLVEANSKLSMSDSVVSLAGPSLAGGLVQLLSAPKAIIVDAVSYLLSAFALGGIGTTEAQPARGRKTFLGEIGEGIWELINTPLLRTLTITSSIGTLAGAVQNTVLVLFLVRELNYTPAQIGFIFACSGAGSLVGG